MKKNPDKSKFKQLLAKEIQLQAKLVEALETGRYFITISCQKKKTADDEHDLQHFWTCHSYNHNDVVSTLKHLAADFTAKENPTGQLAEDKGWH